MSLATRLTALAQAVGADIKSINTKISNATKPMDTWHIVGAAGEPAFTNNWSAFDAVRQTPGFRKLLSGKVELKGIAKINVTAAGQTSIFTLPPGYRPPKEAWYNAYSTVAGGTAVRLEISNLGVVNVAAVASAGQYLSLDGIEFDTESVTELSVLVTGAAQAAVPIDPWHVVGAAGEPAIVSPWITSTPIKFRKDPLGRVWVRGVVSGGVNDTTIFTLPPGYRPPVGSGDIYNDALQSTGAAGGYTFVKETGEVRASRAGTNSIYVEFSFDTETVTTMPTGPQGPKGDPGGSAIVLDTTHLVGAAGEPAFQNGWVALAAGFEPRFRKDAFGKVRLSGCMKSGGVNATAFVLPAGYRPLVAYPELAFPVNSNGVYGSVRVTSTGIVRLQEGNNTYVFLDGIEFDTETVTTMPTGPQGPKGDTGGVDVLTTLDWNTALAPGFYRSTNVMLEHTNNGPGDPLVHPQQAGMVTAHASGALVQRVWDLDYQVAYMRYRDLGGTWTAWVVDLVKPKVFPDAPVGAPNPVDGDIRYVQNAAMKALGVIWKFRYNAGSASANKWEFEGGGKFASGPAGDITTASAAAVPLTGGPSITLPLAGDYEAVISSSMVANAAASGYATASLYKDAVDAGLSISFVFQSATGQAVQPFSEGVITVAAGQVMTIKVSCANAQSNRFVNARIGFRPIRVNM